MAGDLQELAQTDFSGGVNVVTNPYAVGPKQVWRVSNMMLDEHGSLRTRDGFSVVTTSSNTTAPIVYYNVLNRVDGTTKVFAIQQIGTTNTVWAVSGSTFTSLGTTTTQENTPDSVTAVNQQLIANGYETPYTYDGATLSRITALAGQTVPPGAKHVAFHLGYGWVWNTNGSTTTLDGPSSLRSSDANNLGSWPSTNQTFISKDDGQVGMGLGAYTIAEAGISPSQTLVAFKNFSAYQVTGVFGASNFSVQRIKSDMGCIAPRSIQFVSGYGLIRLSHRGFALYNGVDDRLISEEIRPYIFGRDDIAGLNMASVNRSWAAQAPNPPLYVCAAPVSGNTLTRVFLYDLVRKAWLICTYPSDLQTLTLYETQASQPVLRGGMAATGQVVNLFNGDTTDNGAAVSWSFRTRPFFVGSYMRMAFWRRLVVDLLFTKPSQNVTATVTATGLGATASPITKTLAYSGGAAGGLWGTAIWDGFNWDTPSTVDGRLDVALMRTAPSIYVNASGTGPVRVRGLAFHGRSKPLNRVTV